VVLAGTVAKQQHLVTPPVSRDNLFGVTGRTRNRNFNGKARSLPFAVSVKISPVQIDGARCSPIPLPAIPATLLPQ
jgi:hypothetical protein